MADILVLVATTGPLGGAVVRVPEEEGLSGWNYLLYLSAWPHLEILENLLCAPRH